MPSCNDKGQEGQYGQRCLPAVQGWMSISQSQRSIAPQLRSKHHLCCSHGEENERVTRGSGATVWGANGSSLVLVGATLGLWVDSSSRLPRY